jgi:hypothetical protein
MTWASQGRPIAIESVGDSGRLQCLSMGGCVSLPGMHALFREREGKPFEAIAHLVNGAVGAKIY